MKALPLSFLLVTLATLQAESIDFSSFDAGTAIPSNSPLPGTPALTIAIGAHGNAAATAEIASNPLATGGHALKLETLGTTGQPWAYLKETEATPLADRPFLREVTFDLPPAGNGSIFVALISGPASEGHRGLSLNTFQPVDGELSDEPVLVLGFLISNTNAINARRLVGEPGGGSQESYHPASGDWQPSGAVFTRALSDGTAYMASFAYDPDAKTLSLSLSEAGASSPLASASTPLDALHSGIDASSVRLVIGDLFNNATYERHVNVHAVTLESQ